MRFSLRAGAWLVVLALGVAPAAARDRRPVAVPEEIARRLSGEDERVRKCVGASGGAERAFKAERIDLGKDGTNAIVIRGVAPCVCGPRSCVNRVYREAAGGYELIFSADYAQAIEPQKDYTNGYRNLRAAVYTYNTFTSVLYAYHFDGREYRWDHCLMRFYLYAEARGGRPFSGRVRYHPRPEISRVGCDPHNP